MKLPESTRSSACNSNKTLPTAVTMVKKRPPRKKSLNPLPRKLVKMLQTTRGHIATRYLFQIDFVEMYPRAQHHQRLRNLRSPAKGLMLTLLALRYTVPGYLCWYRDKFFAFPPFGFLSIVATDGHERTDIP